MGIYVMLAFTAIDSGWYTWLPPYNVCLAIVLVFIMYLLVHFFKHLASAFEEFDLAEHKASELSSYKAPEAKRKQVAIYEGHINEATIHVTWCMVMALGVACYVLIACSL